MKLTEIFAKLEKIAPVSLSGEFCKKFEMYDNSGILLNCGKEITGVLFSLDLSMKAVEEAKRLKYNLIVTHHPAIYYGVKKFDLTENTVNTAVAECIKNGISVISMHLNFDAAPQGIDYWLMRGLGGNDGKCAAVLKGGGYGRVYSVAEQTLNDFVNGLKREFGTQRVMVFGAYDKKINKVASFCGAGCDEFNMNFAVKNGADVFVSSDMKHHEIAELTARGIAVAVMTHYASESYGLNKIYEKIKQELNVPAEFFRDDELI